MAFPELEQLAKELPEQDGKGRFFWQDYVDRITDRFDGLPAPDGGQSFVQACLAAGCRAVPVMRRNRLWEQGAPPRAHRRRPLYEMRIRLGLFFAASLRDLVHGACRLRVKAGRTAWHVLDGERQSYREFVQAQGGAAPDVSWSKAQPGLGQTYTLAPFFLQRKDILVLTRQVAEEVLDYVRPGDPGGLFGRMLRQDGQVEAAAVDVAGVFLEALVDAVHRKVLRVNTRVNGHVFVTPAFWFVTNPVGVGDVVGELRTRRQGRRYDIPRHEVVQALCSEGHLLGLDGGDAAKAVQTCDIHSDAWDEALELNGLLVLPDTLPGQPVVPHESRKSFSQVSTWASVIRAFDRSPKKQRQRLNKPSSFITKSSLCQIVPCPDNGHESGWRRKSLDVGLAKLAVPRSTDHLSDLSSTLYKMRGNQGHRPRIVRC